MPQKQSRPRRVPVGPLKKRKVVVYYEKKTVNGGKRARDLLAIKEELCPAAWQDRIRVRAFSSLADCSRRFSRPVPFLYVVGTEEEARKGTERTS